MSKAKTQTKEMLINTVAGQECRIAVISEGRLEELYIERTATASHVGNIYKARITNVEPAIQAAFVDAGLGKNGFLHISDVNPTYFPKGKQAPEKVGRKRPHYVRPPIQACLKRGQEVVVQMTKGGIGTKGPTMTTYLSIPGRLIVMMPGMTRLGVSRKVEDEAARAKARAALGELKLPGDMGFIIRTAGVDRSKRDLQRDLNYLLRLWKSVKKRIKSTHAPVELYRESDLVTRTIRDIYDSEIKRVVCDSAADARRIQEFLSVAVPRTKHAIELYTGQDGLFYDSGVEDELERIHSRRVELRSGGSLVIDQTEALVAIDVNSGRYRQQADAETTALKINLEAAEEVVRQLRLRDLGGMIVIDFIDMRDDKNRRKLERKLKDGLKNDRAKTKVLRTSAFGMIQMTRQRLGPSLKQSLFDRCPHCDGTGVVKSSESLSLHVMRSVQRACAHEHVARIEAAVPPDAAHYLHNNQRQQLARLEADSGRRIIVRASADIPPGTAQIRCRNARGSDVAWEHPAPGSPRKGELQTVPVDEVPPPTGADEEPQPQHTAPAPQAASALPAEEGKADTDEPKRRKSRRGRRGGRKHRKKRTAAETPESAKTDEAEAPSRPADSSPAEEAEPPAADHAEPDDDKPAAEKQPEAEKPQAKKPKRRRRGSRKKSPAAKEVAEGSPVDEAESSKARPDREGTKPHGTEEKARGSQAKTKPGQPGEGSAGDEEPPKPKKRVRKKRTRKKAAPPASEADAAEKSKPED